MRKTKIICTLGPSTDNENILRSLMLAGMNVARINFSHQTHEQQQVRVDAIKKLRDELNLPIALLADTKGPEIRIGTFDKPKITLEPGQTFTLTTTEIVGDEKRAYITFEGLPHDVTRGTHILIDDGLIDMIVDSVTETDINCTVINGGVISANKGINVPGANISMPFISARDRADLRFAVKNGFDFVAASFTRTATDIMLIREELERLGCRTMRIIAKIENVEGVNNIDDILKVCDGVMVARGDLGVEIPLEEIPVIQKKLIKKAYRAGKQVITATQMLESMINNPRPTRAETTDIANAIYDGTSAIMLSGETAAGQHPVEAVKTMARIAKRTERDIDYKRRFRDHVYDNLCNVTDAISHATCAAAHDLDAASIITVTKSGGTARMISKYRPFVPIIGCSPDEQVVRQMNLSWGVYPLFIEEKKNSDELFEHAVKVAQNAGQLKEGDLCVITAGVPLGISGTTNMM
ncbi:MAG: pyruvate kinase [Clostridia bacterium]|nr:pyruvate kinase [Clostridia bacterium]